MALAAVRAYVSKSVEVFAAQVALKGSLNTSAPMTFQWSAYRRARSPHASYTLSSGCALLKKTGAPLVPSSGSRPCRSKRTRIPLDANLSTNQSRVSSEVYFIRCDAHSPGVSPCVARSRARCLSCLRGRNGGALIRAGSPTICAERMHQHAARARRHLSRQGPDDFAAQPWRMSRIKGDWPARSSALRPAHECEAAREPARAQVARISFSAGLTNPCSRSCTSSSRSSGSRTALKPSCTAQRGSAGPFGARITDSWQPPCLGNSKSRQPS